MRFQKGNQLGNRAGRPRKGDSLAEAIRARFDAKKRSEAIDKIADLTTHAHDNPLARIKAFECLAKHGWPDEAKGELTLVTDDARPIRIVHEHRDT